MDTIELEEGWLARQMEEVQRDVEGWPDVLKPLITINASLVDHVDSKDDQVSSGPTDPLSKTG